MGTSTVVDKLLPPVVRTVIYTLVLIGSIVCVVLGVLSQDQANQIVLYVSAALGIVGGGLAVVNRPVPDGTRVGTVAPVDVNDVPENGD